ncbi:helix-turn-helix domain-containing protein [Domibacillus indicus]|uniref:helix-turn-helix domain-containing protein n=1 Tax=Domibacillus indicus TaxID=1437523 RepID=UPI000617C847|nr:helix-turn-helix transcriptional regulator [Domibacillus indicus]
MIGIKIKYMRLQQGLSITQLAKKAKISKSYLSYLEKNPATNPSLQIISKIAAALDISPNYFINDHGEDDKKNKKEENSREEKNQEWISVLMDGLEEGMTKEDFEEFQKYIEFLKYRKSR